MTKRTTIVIPFFEGHRFIDACVKSIRSQSPDCSIIIVDNDPSPEPLRCQGADVIIKARTGIGFGRAVNIGVSRAVKDGADLIIVCNQDVLFNAAAIDTLTGSLTENTLQITVPMIYDYDSGQLNPFFERTVLATIPDHKDHLEKSYDVVDAHAACFAFTRTLWDEFGLFDPIFRMYGEDNDLFARLRKKGGSISLRTKAGIRHYHNDLRAEGSEKARIVNHKLRSGTILWLKHGQPTGGKLIKFSAFQIRKALSSGMLIDAALVPLRQLDGIAATIRDSWFAPRDIRKRIARQIEKDMPISDAH